MMRHIGILLGTATSALAVATAAWAADPVPMHPTPPPPSDQPAASAPEEITVTGSRIKRDGYDQPTPVTVVSKDTLLKAAPTNLADGLNQLPQFASSPSGDRCCLVGAQGNFLNLRAAGPNRTLILLDGDRVNPTTETGLVDVNLMPELLVQRVDVVTGGVSAVYGSDAVTGVVNYVIDHKFTGLKLIAEGGLNTYGDDKTAKLGAAGGLEFAEGRGRLVGAFQHYHQDGVFSLKDLPVGPAGYYLAGNGSAAAPYHAVTGAVNASMTDGGIITTAGGVPIANAASPLAGLLFLPGGGTRQATIGSGFAGSSAIFRQGGDGEYINGAGPFASINTNNLYARGEYDLNDRLTAHARVIAGESANYQPFDYERDAASTAFTIFRDNAYLPASVGALMDRSRVSSFTMGRMLREFPRYANKSDNKTVDANIGLDGKFGGNWSWQANASYGKTWAREYTDNNVSLVNLYAAADAVRDPATGNIVCRVTLTNPGTAPGCVPINLFGAGSPSQAAMDYILGRSKVKIANSQTIVSASAQGKLFALPAGDVSLAVGGEFRRRTLDERADAGSTSQIVATGIRGFPLSICPTASTCRYGVHAKGNYGNADASDTVAEGFGEIEAPILRDKPFARRLDINGAFRFTHYKYSGSVETWKVGFEYEPVDGLRFRGARSRDIRAPNLYDLFQGSSISFTPGIIDRQSGAVNLTVAVISQGNPNLKPEKSDTTTVGVVYQPSRIPGLTGSVDYYNINIKDELSAIGAQQTVDNCSQGDAGSCARISRDAGGNITQILSQSINLSSLHIRGVDFDVTYRHALGGGNLSARILGTRLIEYRENAAGVLIDRTGRIAVLGSPEAGPKWRGNLVLNYDIGNVSFFVQERFLGAAKIRPATPAASSYVDPHIPSVFYTDVTLTYRVPHTGVELFGSINNLFNRLPPYIPPQLQPNLALPTNFTFYGFDVRRFTGGARVKF